MASCKILPPHSAWAGRRGLASVGITILAALTFFSIPPGAPAGELIDAWGKATTTCSSLAPAVDEIPWGATLGAGFTEDDFGATGELLFPLFFGAETDTLLFLYPEAGLYDEDRQHYSVGLGLRQYIEQFDAIIGLNAFWDITSSRYDNTYHGFGLGGEILTKWVDGRINWYKTENATALIDSSTSNSSYTSSRNSSHTAFGVPYATVNRILQPSTTTTTTQTTTNTLSQTFERFESPMDGLDVEGGILIPGIDKLMPEAELRAFAGYFAYDNPYGSDIKGFKARGELRLNKYITLDVAYYEDERFFGGHVFGGARVHFPIGKVRKPVHVSGGYVEPTPADASMGGLDKAVAFGKAPPPVGVDAPDTIRYRLTENIIRTPRMITAESDYIENLDKRRKSSKTETSSRTSHHTALILNDVTFVNNDGPTPDGIQTGSIGGDGTAENPVPVIQQGVTIAAAKYLSGGNIPQNVVIAGGGPAYAEDVFIGLPTTIWGSVPAPGGYVFNADRPRIDGGLGAFDVPAVAIRNLDVFFGRTTNLPAGPAAGQGYGVYLANVTNPAVTGVIVANAADRGIVVFNGNVPPFPQPPPDIDVEISGNLVAGSLGGAGAGIAILNTLGSVSGEFFDNVAGANAGDGFNILGRTGVDLDSGGNFAVRNSGHGLFIQTIMGDVHFDASNGRFDQNGLGNVAGVGLGIAAVGGNIFFDAASSSFSDNLDQGIRLSAPGNILGNDFGPAVLNDLTVNNNGREGALFNSISRNVSVSIADSSFDFNGQAGVLGEGDGFEAVADNLSVFFDAAGTTFNHNYDRGVLLTAAGNISGNNSPARFDGVQAIGNRLQNVWLDGASGGFVAAVVHDSIFNSSTSFTGFEIAGGVDQIFFDAFRSSFSRNRSIGLGLFGNNIQGNNSPHVILDDIDASLNGLDGAVFIAYQQDAAVLISDSHFDENGQLMTPGQGEGFQARADNGSLSFNAARSTFDSNFEHGIFLDAAQNISGNNGPARFDEVQAIGNRLQNVWLDGASGGFVAAVVHDSIFNSSTSFTGFEIAGGVDQIFFDAFRSSFSRNRSIGLGLFGNNIQGNNSPHVILDDIDASLNGLDGAVFIAYQQDAAVLISDSHFDENGQLMSPGQGEGFQARADNGSLFFDADASTFNDNFEHGIFLDANQTIVGNAGPASFSGVTADGNRVQGGNLTAANGNISLSLWNSSFDGNGFGTPANGHGLWVDAELGSVSFDAHSASFSNNGNATTGVGAGLFVHADQMLGGNSAFYGDLTGITAAANQNAGALFVSDLGSASLSVANSAFNSNGQGVLGPGFGITSVTGTTYLDAFNSLFNLNGLGGAGTGLAINAATGHSGSIVGNQLNGNATDGASLTSPGVFSGTFSENTANNNGDDGFEDNVNVLGIGVIRGNNSATGNSDANFEHNGASPVFTP